MGWAAGVGIAETTAAAVTVSGAVETANVACGGDMCASEAQDASQAVQEGLPAVQEAGTQLYRVIDMADDQFAKFQETGVLEPRGGPSTLVQHVNEGLTNSSYTSWTKSLDFAEDIYTEGQDAILTLNTNDIANRTINTFSEWWNNYAYEAEITIEGPIKNGISIYRK